MGLRFLVLWIKLALACALSTHSCGRVLASILLASDEWKVNLPFQSSSERRDEEHTRLPSSSSVNTNITSSKEEPPPVRAWLHSAPLLLLCWVVSEVLWGQEQQVWLFFDAYLWFLLWMQMMSPGRTSLGTRTCLFFQLQVVLYRGGGVVERSAPLMLAN